MVATQETSPPAGEQVEEHHKAGGATKRVLAITELLEHILQFVNIPTLMSQAQRTCRRWREVIQQLVETSLALRRRLFLAPATFYEMSVLQEEFQDIATLAIWIKGGRDVGSCLINPYLKPQLNTADSDSSAYGVRIDGRELFAAAHSGSIRSAMYLAQPPPEFSGVFTEHSPRIDRQPRVSAHLCFGEPNEGDVLFAPTLAQAVAITEMGAVDKTSFPVLWEQAMALIYGDASTSTDYFDELNGGLVELDESMWSILENRT